MRLMQETLDALAAERRFPVLGEGRRAVDVAAPPEIVWEPSPTRRATCTSWPASRAGRSSASQATGLGARYRMLMRVGSAEVGGLIEVVEFTPGRDLAWNSVTGIDQRGRWRLRERGGGRTRRAAPPVRRRRRGLWGWLAERSPPHRPRQPAALAAAAQAPGRARAAAREGRRAAATRDGPPCRDEARPR